jgi:hypothetical protein
VTRSKVQIRQNRRIIGNEHRNHSIVVLKIDFHLKGGAAAPPYHDPVGQSCCFASVYLPWDPEIIFGNRYRPQAHVA